jgi:hypothetical protein
MNIMLEYVVYRTTGLEYIFQLLLLKMSVEATVRRFLRHSLVCATRLWGTLKLLRGLILGQSFDMTNLSILRRHRLKQEYSIP